MEEFKLDKVKAVVKPKISSLSTSMQSSGPDGEPVPMTEVQVELHVECDEVMGDLENLFPWAKVFCDYVAGLGEDGAGEVRKSRRKLPECTVDIFYGDKAKRDANADPRVHMPGARVVAQPELRVSEEGKPTLVIKPRGKVNDFHHAQLNRLIKADVYVSLTPSQLALGDRPRADPKAEDKPESDGPPKRGGKPPRRGKGAAQAAQGAPFDPTADDRADIRPRALQG